MRRNCRKVNVPLGSICFQALVAVGLLYSAGHSQSRSIEELVDDQMSKKGYYVVQDRQSWNIGKEGKESEYTRFTEFRIVNRRGWNSILPVIIAYDWKTEVEDFEIILTRGARKPEK